MRTWLLAARPRTLLLATASIGMGVFLAAADGEARWGVALLSLLSAVLLQILSNLANDYGDARHGADSGSRVGPKRAVQSGLLTPARMRNAIVLTALTAALCGLLLVWSALGSRGLVWSFAFIALGGAAIWSAIAYTATRKPYGYVGLGDLMVFLFFGPVAVLGSYFLQVGALRWALVLPAVASGLLAVAVLNVNNIRDLESDRLAGKRSLPVRVGLRKARVYHLFLLVGSAAAALAYVLLEYLSPWQFLFVLALPMLAQNGFAVWRWNALELDPLLKQMSISTLVFTALFGVGQLLA